MAAASEVNSFLRHILFSQLRRPFAAGALLVLALAAALFAVSRADFENDIARMLPDGSESARAYRKITDSAMFNKAMILLSADSPAPFSTPEFAEKCRALAEKLRAHKPEILRVDCELFRGTPMESLSALFAYVPLYTSPAALPPAPELARRTMKQLLLPSSTGRAAMIQLDPPGLLSPVYAALNRFRAISGFSAAMDTPFLMTEDHRHLLINIETSLPVSDPESGRRLLAVLEPAIAEAGFAHEIKSELILPHRRAIANEQVVKNDIGLVTLFSIILLPLLVIFVYRGDPRSLLLPAVPFLAALLTAALTVLIFPRPQLFAIGIGGVIIGVALDYGIHIYSAMNTRGPLRSLCRLLPPLLLSMATSCAAFGLFLFSPMEAIRQLGFFAGTSLLLSLILMLVLLPPVLRGRRPAPELPLGPLEKSRRHPRMVVALFVSAALSAVLFLPRLHIRADVRQYDMSPASYDELEHKVPELFQTPGVESAMALFGGKTRDEALRHASAVSGQPEIFSIAELLPPEELRRKHLAEWRGFPLEQYRSELRTAGKKLGFRDGYFDEFLNALAASVQNPPHEFVPPPLRAAADRLLVQGRSGEWNAAALYRESPENEARLLDTPGATLISRNHIPKIMARDIMRGILPSALAGLAAVILLVACHFRSVRSAASALLPVVLSILFTAGLFGALGKGINIPVMAAGIILCALAVDYGVFVIHALRAGRERLVFHAVTLSALTTLAGGLTVAFTRHPMLSDAGCTLIAGIFFAWASAVFLLPVLHRKGES